MFSEFTMFDFAVFNRGGTNLGVVSQYPLLERGSTIGLPCLLLYVFERDELYKYTQQYLTQQWSEHLARD